jgi:condensin complex subunit 1
VDCSIAADTRQWEYISYCLSQLAFTEKGMKKLIDSFKTFEHVLSEDSVMDNFKSIIIKVLDFCNHVPLPSHHL